MKYLLKTSKKMQNNILFISAQDTYQLRWEILRKGFPLDSVKFENDFSVGTFHLGYFIDEELVGIISLSIHSFPEKDLKNCFQLRGMAVLEKARGKSVGKQLCLKAEEILKIFDIDCIWCNARATAVGFYEKLGYAVLGEEFEIPTAGKHFKMWKKIE